MLFIGINGAAGKMSKEIAIKILQKDHLAITEIFENTKHPYIGIDYGTIIGIEEWGIKLNTLKNKPKYKMQILIDFSSPQGFRKALNFAYNHSLKFISGTTGLNKKDFDIMKEYAQKIPILYSSNMSTGINNILLMLENMKIFLNNKNRDIEIIEYHHKMKKDAPSGTAFLLANKIQSLTGRTIDTSNKNNFPRDYSIRIHSVRAGDISGIHKIFISGEGETIEITHTAHSRDTFANGVVDAVDFINKKNSGLYNMIDIIKGKQ